MLSRIRPLALLMATGALAGACSDPNQFGNLAPTITDTLVVFALTGSPLSAPTALNIGARAVVRATGDFDYDIAFDIDGAGRAVLYPIRIVGGGFTASRTVGIQKVSGSFDQLTKAPSTGYRYDSTTVVAAGETVAVATLSATCVLGLSNVLYGKIGIDAVDTQTRAIRMRLTVDPNCGFQSLGPGVPKS